MSQSCGGQKPWRTLRSSGDKGAIDETPRKPTHQPSPETIMKPRTSVAISVLATAIALSFGANAAPDTPDNTRAGNPQKTAPVDSSHAMPRHSHVAEKLGIPAEQTAPADDKAQKKDTVALKRHDHQRDMK